MKSIILWTWSCEYYESGRFDAYNIDRRLDACSIDKKTMSSCLFYLEDKNGYRDTNEKKIYAEGIN